MRLLSYNIHKGIGGRDRRYRFERIIDVIAAENPDIICLQEVDSNVRRSKFHDQAQLLAAHFSPAAMLLQSTVRLASGGYGNLILSRWPFREKHQISLRLGVRKPRGSQLVIIDTPSGPLHLVHWHLGLAEHERQWQVAHVLKHPLFRRSCHLPTMVVGDTNDWRNTLATGPLAAHGLEHITSPVSRFRSFPAYFALGSLDKAFRCPQVRVEHAHLVRTALARAASDHLPLVIDFDVSPSAGNGQDHGHRGNGNG